MKQQVRGTVAVWTAALLAAGAAAQPAASDVAPPDGGVRAAEQARVDVLARAAGSVVCIFAERTLQGGGSGVLIDSAGYGLTNFHVVQEFVESRRGYGGLSDGRLYRLRVIGLDPGGDVALFRLEGAPRFEAAPLGDSDALRIGQTVAAIGNPFVLAEDFRPTVSVGMISGLHRYQEGQGNLLEYADCIQVSTSINPGNSGGPLFDLQGRVIGINGRASFEERGRVNVGLGYAISINQIKRFLPALYAGRLTEHGTLGVQVREVGPRVVINAIQDFSPADKAGLQLGDALHRIGDRPLRTANDFTNYTAIYPAGWPVRVAAERDGALLEVVARLERLALGAPIVYAPDMAHNHEVVGRLFERARAAAGLENSPIGSALEWRGRLHDVQTGQSEELTAVTRAGLDAADDWPAAGESGASDDSGRIAAEFARLAAPLLRSPEWSLDWELLGGDEVAGRVAGVVRRRGPQPDSAEQARPEARWLFDWETGAFVEFTLGDSDEPDRVRWEPAVWGTVDGVRFPTEWLRRRGEAAWRVEWTQAASAPRPAGAPSAATAPAATGEGRP